MKRLTPANWLEPDPVIASGLFVGISADGSVRSLNADHWVSRLLRVAISPAVPEVTRELFEVARGAMIYGGLFYPLFTLGLEQVFRVAEAAVRAKAASIGVPLVGKKGNTKRYSDLLNDLRNCAVLSDEEHARWSNARELRNATTHADRQTILPPAAAADLLASIAELISHLFAEPTSLPVGVSAQN